MDTRLGRRLRCRHCRYEWTYRGKSKYYANCPRCHFQVHIKRQLIPDNTSESEKQRESEDPA